MKRVVGDTQYERILLISLLLHPHLTWDQLNAGISFPSGAVQYFAEFQAGEGD